MVARRVLLDGLIALQHHLDAITVVGAQAVYLRTEEAAIPAAAYTSDGDLGIDPARLLDEPRLECALRNAGFRLLQENQPGLWSRDEIIEGKVVPVELDLLVGATLAAGRRAARIKPHDKMTARRVPGLETAVVDRSPMVIKALDSEDNRAMTVHVAGPAALLVAKAFKISDRLVDSGHDPERLVDKDAGDVLRIMMTNSAHHVEGSFRALIANDRVGGITCQGLQYLHELFGGADTPGVRMAIRALAGGIPESRVRALAPAFTKLLRSAP